MGCSHCTGAYLQNNDYKNINVISLTFVCHSSVNSNLRQSNWHFAGESKCGKNAVTQETTKTAEFAETA